MKPIYLGFVGPIASGKGFLIAHLKDLGFDVYSLSDEVRREARTREIPLTRENLQNLGDELRNRYGGQVLAERALCSVTNVEKNIVFDSIRNPSEIALLRSLTDIKIIGVDAPPELRAKWYLQRAKDRGEDVPDLEHFFQASLRDSGYHESISGQQVNKCMAQVDILINNCGTKSEVLAELDRYLKSEFNFDPELHRRSKER